MKKFLAVVFLVVPLVANAEDSKWKWTKVDTAFQAASIVTFAVDWNQTRQIATERYVDRRRRKMSYIYSEGGPAKMFIGSHPHRDRVDAYFLGSMILNTAVAYALPNPYRRMLQVGTIVYEVYSINHNYGIGIRVKF